MGNLLGLKKFFCLKIQQPLQEITQKEAASEAENILIQETTDESENDLNYEY